MNGSILRTSSERRASALGIAICLLLLAAAPTGAGQVLCQNVSFAIEPTTSQSPQSWALDRINQRALPLDGETLLAGGRGAGWDVYVLDTGLNWADSLLYPRVAGGWSAFDDDWSDDNGHGTAVAATIVAVAPQIRIWSVKVFLNGAGDSLSVSAGFLWAAENIELQGRPAVINYSGGGPSNLQIDSAACVAREVAAVVVAAGNYASSACNISPARVADLVTVSATKQDDSLPVWANTGPCVDLYAPGFEIPVGDELWDGTSFSAPLVAGIYLRGLDALEFPSPPLPMVYGGRILFADNFELSHFDRWSRCVTGNARSDSELGSDSDSDSDDDCDD